VYVKHLILRLARPAPEDSGGGQQGGGARDNPTKHGFFVQMRRLRRATHWNANGRWDCPIQDGLTRLSGYRCELTNYGTNPVFDFQMILDLSFYEAVPPPNQPNAKTYGSLQLCRGWLIEASKIDVGHGSAFVFYIYNNLTDKIVNVLIPKTGTLCQLGEKQRREVGLTVTQLGGEVPLQVWPNFSNSK
jgi:hypothetical protein